jgi:hypothetical protein
MMNPEKTPDNSSCESVKANGNAAAKVTEKRLDAVVSELHRKPTNSINERGLMGSD